MLRMTGKLEPITAELEREVEQPITMLSQRQPFTLMFTLVNHNAFEMYCRRKLEHCEETHADSGRTSHKLKLRMKAQSSGLIYFHM